MVDVVEGFVIGDCCFANSQSVCLIFRARFLYSQYFESLKDSRCCMLRVGTRVRVRIASR